MLSSYLTQLKSYQDHCFVIGCSGGVDSMALSHWLITKGFTIHLVHINYHKRGESSDLDQQCVEQFAEANKVPISSFDYNQNKARSTNFQEAARNFRYEKFQSIAANYPKSLIALAHHNDDQLETFFMNLSRKSGVLGLASMPFLHNNLVRPFLNASKTEIIDYAKKQQLEWREDESNSENNYTRNRWRNEFIPLIAKEIPTIKESVNILISHFQSLQSEIESKVSPIVSKIKQGGKLSLESKLNFNEFELFEIWRQFDQSPAKFPFFMQLFDLDKGKRVEMTGEYSLVTKENDYLLFSKTNEEIVIPELEITSVQALPLTYFKDEIYLDSEKLTGELKIRHWENGDLIQPIGMKGKQLVSDIIKDAKIDSHSKKDVFVAHDKLNLHWVVGLKVGRLAVATEMTKSIVKVQVKN